MGRGFAAAAAAFAETLDALDLAREQLPDQTELGRRAALLAVSEVVWQQHLGPLLEGDQVRALLRVRTRQAVNDLVKRHRILAVSSAEGRLVYPAFQFGPGGRPYEAMPRVLGVLAGAGVSAHTLASWFRSPQRALGGATPAVWLAEGRDTAALVEAARRSAARLAR